MVKKQSCAESEAADPRVTAWLITEALKENKNQTSPPSPSFSCAPYGENKSKEGKKKKKRKGLNVKSADCAQSNMSEDVFLTFILGKKIRKKKKKQERKTRLSVEISEEALLCPRREGNFGWKPNFCSANESADGCCFPLSCPDGCASRCGLGKSHSKRQNDASSSICIFLALF